MPAWLGVPLGILGVCVLLAVLWQHVGRPLFRMGEQADRLFSTLQRLEVLLSDLTIDGANHRRTLSRLETASADLVIDRASVAADLVVAKAVVEGVADDLDASHARADAAPDGDAGAAADAASRSEPNAVPSSDTD